jgi:hypothetical protein
MFKTILGRNEISLPSKTFISSLYADFSTTKRAAASSGSSSTSSGIWLEISAFTPEELMKLSENSLMLTLKSYKNKTRVRTLKNGYSHKIL